MLGRLTPQDSSRKFPRDGRYLITYPTGAQLLDGISVFDSVRRICSSLMCRRRTSWLFIGIEGCAAVLQRCKSTYWSAGGAGYTITMDTQTFRSGAQSLCIREVDPAANVLGIASHFSSATVRGRHVRASGWM